MPRKKLTKAQVKRKMRSMLGSANLLALDKFTNKGDSNVTMSFDKLRKMGDDLFLALKRVK